MNLQHRIKLLAEAGNMLQDEVTGLPSLFERAERENSWFVPMFTRQALQNMVSAFLQEDQLRAFAEAYQIPSTNETSKTVGLVCAGNIPMVGFHDLLMVLLSGHGTKIKFSSKDKVLMDFVVRTLRQLHPDWDQQLQEAEQLRQCDAYIATGSNNSSRYFEYYFSKYPSIIRRNRTSVAILNGSESELELKALAADMFDYFGLGCRNVTALRVPEGYDWVPLLHATNAYSWMKDHNKMRNNYDYQLSLHILNNTFYMTDGVALFLENDSIFSPISSVHYQYYKGDFDAEGFITQHREDLQCLVGQDQAIQFGHTQQPTLTDFADGVDTMAFLLRL